MIIGVLPLPIFLFLVLWQKRGAWMNCGDERYIYIVIWKPDFNAETVQTHLWLFVALSLCCCCKGAKLF